MLAWNTAESGILIILILLPWLCLVERGSADSKSVGDARDGVAEPKGGERVVGYNVVVNAATEGGEAEGAAAGDKGAVDTATGGGAGIAGGGGAEWRAAS